MKLSEARIHAHICSDGYTNISFARRNVRDIEEHHRKQILRKYYNVRYSNTQPLLLRLFQEDVMDAYGRKAFIVNDEAGVQGKWIFDRLRKMGALDSYNWRVCPQILKGSKTLSTEWLKAFFDDEGTVDESRRRVRVKSVNEKGLKQAKKMLDKIKVESKITGPNCDKTWYLTVNYQHIRRFSKLIGFRHPERSRRLKHVLT